MVEQEPRLGGLKEVKVFQRKLRAMVSEGINLVDVIHVMLHHRILPLQV